MKPTEPSAGAMRAAEAIGRLLDDLYNCGLTTDRVCLDQWQDRVAAIIDRESGLSELQAIVQGVITALAYPRGSEAQVRCMEEIGQDANRVIFALALTKSQENALAVGEQKPRW